MIAWFIPQTKDPSDQMPLIIPVYENENIIMLFDEKLLNTVGPRWAPCWPHDPCYQGVLDDLTSFFSQALSVSIPNIGLVVIQIVNNLLVDKEEKMFPQ